MPSNPTNISQFALVPSRSVPTTFEVNADSFLTSLTNFKTQYNSAINTNASNNSELRQTFNSNRSTSQHTISLGTKTFNLNNSFYFQRGFVKFIAETDPDDYMVGIALGNSTYDIIHAEGTGKAYSSWIVQLCGEPPPIQSPYTPASNSFGVPGDWCWDENYFYVCVENNTWMRTPLSSW